MSTSRRRVFRLAILILAIPVFLLLFLHFFGENEMSVDYSQSMEDCARKDRINVILTGDEALLSNQDKNQLNRVKRTLLKKKLSLDTNKYACLSDTLALLLVDTENNLRGSYLLEQREVNRLFVELDIVRMHDNYGKEVSR